MVITLFSSASHLENQMFFQMTFPARTLPLRSGKSWGIRRAAISLVGVDKDVPAVIEFRPHEKNQKTSIRAVNQPGFGASVVEMTELVLNWPSKRSRENHYDDNPYMRL